MSTMISGLARLRPVSSLPQQAVQLTSLGAIPATARRYACLRTPVNPTPQPRAPVKRVRFAANSVLRRPVRIVLTGGPCGGKSTTLDRLSERLTREGWKVYKVPEAATLLITSGVNLTHKPRWKDQVISQERLVQMQEFLEDCITAAATADVERGQPCVVVCDRGILDNKAYSQPQEWAALLAVHGARSETELESRYDLVLHLVTAAIGAREHYTTSNNTARQETPDEAAQLDMGIRHAWGHHAHVRVIENNGEPFAGKVARAIEAVRTFLQDICAPGPI